jgi:hypothetical protein
LKAGLNKGVYLAAKVLDVLSKKGDVPAYLKPLYSSFVIVDNAANFGCLSLYNTNNNIYEEVREGADITVAEPVVKNIKVGDFSYQCVQVFEVNRLLVNDSPIIDKFSPNILVNETF